MADPKAPVRDAQISVISEKYLSRDWVVWLMNWVNSVKRHNIVLGVYGHPEIELGRSMACKDVRAMDPKPKWWIQIDTDVIVENSLDDVLTIAEMDRAVGYHVLTSPGLASTGNLNVRVLNEKGKVRSMQDKDEPEPPVDRPFPIDGGWCGLTLMSEPAYMSLAPVGIKCEDELFCHHESSQSIKCDKCGETKHIEGRGEDFDLYFNATRGGFPPMAEPRFLTRHMKLGGIPSYRQGVMLDWSKIKGDAE